MSTYDVPGSNPSNNDELSLGCWAEHDDGSLIFVESTEGNRVVYSIFDMSKTPIIEYRDAMAESTFKKQFSWNKNNKKQDKWLWHDKSAFPWDRVIKKGAQDGLRHASAADTLTAAERVAESLKLHARAFDEGRAETMMPQQRNRVNTIINRLKNALDDLGQAIGDR